MKIAAVIPAYNVESTIGDVIRDVSLFADEIIVVDDGSTDNTFSVARMAMATVVAHRHNKGYGKALQSGFLLALTTYHDIVVTIDGDGQHDPYEIPRLVSPILLGKADVVLGSRFLTKNTVPLYRKIGIKIITKLFNWKSPLKVTDAQCGFRAYHRSVIERLNLSDDGMGASIEILDRIKDMNVRVVEVPVSCKYDHKHISPKAIKHGFSVLWKC